MAYALVMPSRRPRLLGLMPRMHLMVGACYVAIHEQDAGSDDRRVHRRRARLYSPRTGYGLLDPAERRRGLSAQDLARRSRCRPAEAVADRDGTDRAWLDAP